MNYYYYFNNIIIIIIIIIILAITQMMVFMRRVTLWGSADLRTSLQISLTRGSRGCASTLGIHTRTCESCVGKYYTSNLSETRCNGPDPPLADIVLFGTSQSTPLWGPTSSLALVPFSNRCGTAPKSTPLRGPASLLAHCLVSTPL